MEKSCKEMFDLWLNTDDGVKAKNLGYSSESTEGHKAHRSC